MNKAKRLFALLSAVLLLGLYISTFIFAMMDSEFSQKLLLASIALTILLPVILYGMILIHKLVKHSEEEIEEE